MLRTRARWRRNGSENAMMFSAPAGAVSSSQLAGACTAGVTTRDIDAVFMSGGTTQLPIVREGVARDFGKEPRCEVNPMEVVAIGASLFSNGED